MHRKNGLFQQKDFLPEGKLYRSKTELLSTQEIINIIKSNIEKKTVDQLLSKPGLPIVDSLMYYQCGISDLEKFSLSPADKKQLVRNKQELRSVFVSLKDHLDIMDDILNNHAPNPYKESNLAPCHSALYANVTRELAILNRIQEINKLVIENLDPYKGDRKEVKNDILKHIGEMEKKAFASDKPITDYLEELISYLESEKEEINKNHKKFSKPFAFIGATKSRLATRVDEAINKLIPELEIEQRKSPTKKQ